MGDFAPSTVLISRLRWFTRASAIFSTVVGTLVLLGWFTGAVSLTVLLPGLASMKVNTAICLALCGVSLWFMRPKDSESAPRESAPIFGGCLASIVLVVGLTTLAEYFLHRSLGIDQLLVIDRFGDGHSVPGRMAPHTALCFVVLAVALWLIPLDTRRGFRPSQFLSFVPAVTSMMAILGYLYSVVSLYRIASYTGMALHTAITIFILSLGVLLSTPDRGLTAVVSSDSLGGIVTRRLLPAAFFLPVVIGWLRMEGQKAGLYDTGFGLALMVTVNIMLFSTVIYLSGKEISRIEARRQAAERALQTSQDGLLAMNYTFESIIAACPLPVVTLDRDSKIQVWNHAAERSFGWSWLQLRGRRISLSPDDHGEVFDSVVETLERGESVSGVETVVLASDDTRVSVTLWAAPIIIGARGFSGSVLVIEDIARRKGLASKLEGTRHQT
jgi:PAS domain S-box-containing protein